MLRFVKNVKVFVKKSDNKYIVTKENKNGLFQRFIEINENVKAEFANAGKSLNNE